MSEPAEIFFQYYSELLRINHRDTHNLYLKKNKTEENFSVLCNAEVLFKIIKYKTLGMCLVFNRHEKIIQGNKLPCKRLKSIGYRLSISSYDDINTYASALIEIFDSVSDKVNGKWISGCHLYEECSNALHCVNENKNISSVCHYKRNLKQGKVFFGENRVQNQDGGYTVEKIRKNKAYYFEEINKVNIGGILDE